MRLWEWKRLFLSVLSAGALFVGLAGTASATLIDRGEGTFTYGLMTVTTDLIYDDDLNITWLDFQGSGNWIMALNWASDLVVSFDGRTYDDWRLPTTVDGPWSYGYDGSTTTGFNITSSEMGHLYYTELGNKGYYGTNGAYQSDYGLQNNGPFERLVHRSNFWSGTEAAGTGNAYNFSMGSGAQLIWFPLESLYALAVRPGDVYVPPPSAPVPEPSTMLMLGTGLIGLIGAGMRRRGQRQQ